MTTLAEPEWDADTRELALALDQIDTCTICGGPRWLCQDPELAYDHVAEARRCYRRTAMLEKSSALTEEANPHREALEWTIGLRPSSLDPTAGGR